MLRNLPQNFPDAAFMTILIEDIARNVALIQTLLIEKGIVTREEMMTRLDQEFNSSNKESSKRE